MKNNIVKVKICGIRTLESAQTAIDAGADYLGFNFVPESTRYIKPKNARGIINAVKGKAKIVGIFKNASSNQVNKIADDLNLDFIQLHGSENEEYMKQINKPIIKATSSSTLSQTEKSKAKYILLDREVQGKGELVNSQLAKRIAKKYDIFLAGGLTPENVSAIVREVQPYAVDVASGIETNGKEDINKITTFITQAKTAMKKNNTHTTQGHFGTYGGRYVPEMLIPALEELTEEYEKAKHDKSFQTEFSDLLHNFSGRPTPLVLAKNLTSQLGGAKIYLKNEGLNHTGAHKITHCIGQALIAKRLGKTRLIAETGAGQHGVATATVAAKLGFSCTVFMGEVDVARQRPNVFLMEQLGATVIPVTFGSRTLKDAVNAAIKDWIANVADTHYLLGSALGPHPFPTMNRDFQSIIGREIKKQLYTVEKVLPDYVIACVGGGSNALGAFTEFVKQPSVTLVGVEAGGRGKRIGEHAVRFPNGKVGVIEGYKSYFIQDTDGQLQPTHSISAGLDYPGIGPELSYLHDTKRVEFVSAMDDEVLKAVQVLAKTEGIIPALESAHAVAYALKLAPTLPKEKIIVINLSGRGDKDIFIMTKAFKDKKFYEFMKRQVEEGY